MQPPLCNPRYAPPALRTSRAAHLPRCSPPTPCTSICMAAPALHYPPHRSSVDTPHRPGLAHLFLLTTLPNMCCHPDRVEFSTLVADCLAARLPPIVHQLLVPTLPQTTVSCCPIQYHALFLGLFASLVAPFGGFFASGIKRAYKLDDFASIIPGQPSH